MASTKRAAPGPAAGYHYQVQRALLDLLAAEGDDPTVALESLDDLVLAGDEVTTLEQLKHSIRAGSLTDASPRMWEALDAWMDLDAELLSSDALRLRLVTTIGAPDGSAAACLRRDDGHNPREAERLLLEAARTSKNADTQGARERFLGEGNKPISDATRSSLISRIEVLDAQPGVAEFQAELRARLRTTLPLTGVDEFIRQVVGMWESVAVRLLLTPGAQARRSDLDSEIARIRDGFTDRTLPDPYPAETLDHAILEAYNDAPFVHQLQLIRMSSDRVRRAIDSYHRAFAQRSTWLDQGIILPGDLALWEERLVYEWGDARERMIERLPVDCDDDALAGAGRELHDEVQATSTVLRGSPDRWLLHGTHHGLAEVGAIGWHRDFRERLQHLLAGAGGAPGATFRALRPVARRQ